ncbi:hypothetical protein EJ08DRAFT_702227 [Tothia fuscella]|uniref:Uncharacterized protein n=1 Tax=Tothia fuscella TaxID=1048955 RepID=A0A9P4TTR7_9PEZI|nr:hypothetical protein EJ08DRAFT_702227 [Tothia fuscella]
MKRNYWTDVSLTSPPPQPSEDPDDLGIARKKSQKRANEIFTRFRSLQALVQDYGNIIKERCAKKNPDARKKLLLIATPDMLKRCDHDWVALWSKLQQQESFLWSSINIRNLAEGDTLLTLLDERASNHPCTFTPSDLESARMGLVTNGIDRIQNPCLTNFTMAMEILGANWRLASGDPAKHREIQDFIEGLWTPQPGLLALEIQAYIMEFAGDVTKLIFKDVDLENTLTRSPLAKVQACPLTGLANDTSSAVSSMIISKAPYRAPGSLDYDGLVKVVEAEAQTANIHLMALREDPGYFATILDQIRSHEKRWTTTILIDPSSGPAAMAGPSKKKLKAKPGLKKTVKKEVVDWKGIACQVIVDSHSYAAFWMLIKKALCQIREYHDQHADDIKTGLPIPDEYLGTLQGLKEMISKLRNIILEKLRQGSPVSNTTFQLLANPDTAGQPQKHVKLEDRVSLLIDILEDGRYEQAIGIHNVQRKLDTVVRELCTKNTSSTFSSWHLDLISELGIVAEVERQFKLFKHQQMAYSGEYDLEFRHPSIKFEDAIAICQTAEYGAELCRSALEGLDLAALAAPIGGRFDYPIGRKSSKATAQTMIKAEQDLDEFWNAVDEQIERVVGDSATLLRLFMLPSLENPLCRTQPWVENPTQASEGKSRASTKVEEDKGTTFPFSASYTEPESSRNFQLPLLPKERKKTRGIAAPEPEQPEEAERPATPEAIKFKVLHKQMPIIEALFPQPGMNAPAEVRWTDFAQTMTKIGFAVSHQGGSKYLFVPDLELTGHTQPITFHEPHPNRNLNLNFARHNGRRLKISYGWSAETFEEV